MYRAFLETDHYTFEAYGLSEKEAKRVLIEGCKKHCKEVDFSYSEFKSNYPNDDISVAEIKIGTAYRDYQEI